MKETVIVIEKYSENWGDEGPETKRESEDIEHHESTNVQIKTSFIEIAKETPKT